LVYQAVWSRLLTLSIGNTAPARTTACAAFIGGLALGALVTARDGKRDSINAPRRALAQSTAQRLSAATALIQALGGGWRTGP